MLSSVMLAWTLTTNATPIQKTQAMSWVGQAPQSAPWIPTQVIISSPIAENLPQNCDITIKLSDPSEKNPKILFTQNFQSSWFQPANPIAVIEKPILTPKQTLGNKLNLTINTYSTDSNPACNINNLRIDVLAYSVGTWPIT